ncbi:uncharacterized protein [Montipora capricornis]|uniref:uncharacterized protein n=1 Tax=Montipora capricornis TaxID=246305 RepID=UPI0035F15516
MAGIEHGNVTNEEFMEEVARYECVYNRNSKDFKDKNKKANSWGKIGGKFNLSAAEAEVKFRNIRTAYGSYLKRLKTIPSGSGRDAVPREFQNLEWLNPHIAHRPSSTNLRSTSPGTVESSSLPANDNEDDFSAEVVDESGESTTVSPTNDSIETESPELEEVNESNRVNGETTGGCSNGKTPKSTRSMRAWSRSNGNAGAEVDKAIMNTANSIADHLKQIGSKRKQTEDLEDEDSLFCRSLVPRLKRLPSQRRAFLRLEIEQLLYQTEFTGSRTQPNFPQNGYGHSTDYPYTHGVNREENPSTSRTYFQL